MKFLYFLSLPLFLVFTSCADKIPDELPNILWITSEDNSPFLGCYGDDYATTPNLDKLASEGILYNYAYANAPVCAPARNTIITGVYACSGGNEHMRSQFKKSEEIQYYPEYLRKIGYYCTNNSKEDYNIFLPQTEGIWDETSEDAHYMKRKEGQPFFAIFNSTISHESSIHRYKADSLLRHSPEKVHLPPYHPDIPEMRHDWAHYYDNVEDMDTWVGKILQELEESGEAENTIVFYYGDHGGVLGRSKRFLYESGTHVPFLVRIPEKYKYLLGKKQAGSQDDRLISFVDLAPTLLSICGIPIPEYMQGNAFLGTQKTPDPENAYMFRGRMDERYDMSRSVRNKKYRYTINFMPHRPYGQHLNYLWNAPSLKAWEAAWINGECNEVQSAFFQSKPTEELYMTGDDPWEVNNLANDPAYQEVLSEMRITCKDWLKEIHDPGFIPEPIRYELYGSESMYDVVRTGDFPLEKIMEAAWLSAEQDEKNIPQLTTLMKDEDPSVRYWGATGLLTLGPKAIAAEEALLNALGDECETVSCVASEALYILGYHKEALSYILKNMDSENMYVRCFAMNTIDCQDIEDQSLLNKVIEIRKAEDWNLKDYDKRMVLRLLEKWGLDDPQSWK